MPVKIKFNGRIEPVNGCNLVVDLRGEFFGFGPFNDAFDDNSDGGGYFFNEFLLSGIEAMECPKFHYSNNLLMVCNGDYGDFPGRGLASTGIDFQIVIG